MTKRFGFTLAEVLITLGIIGVVAAMTIPTLINQTNGAQYKAAYKKGISMISQAVTLNMALDDENFGTISGSTDAVKDILTQRMNIAASGDGLPAGYTAPEGVPTTDSYIITTDGIMLAYAKGANCTAATKDANGNVTAAGTACVAFIDVNGSKGPNALIGDKGNTVTDIYPVVIEEQSVLPASEAAKSVLYDKEALGDKTLYSVPATTSTGD